MSVGRQEQKKIIQYLPDDGVRKFGETGNCTDFLHHILTNVRASTFPARFGKEEFQYRERVGPFAAQGGSMKGPIDVLFQYRERVGPFAAPPFRGHYVTKARRVSKIHRALTVVKTSLCYIQYYHIFEK